MSKLRFRLPSPALVLSMVALALALGGTAVAASTAGDTAADTKLIKKLAPTLSVKHATTANSLAASSLSFTAPTLVNGWTAEGNGFGSPGYAKDPFGIVHLTGAVGHIGASGAVIFTLPPGFRPAASVNELGVVPGPAAEVVRINGNGDVIPVSGGTTYLDLDGINFQAGS